MIDAMVPRAETLDRATSLLPWGTNVTHL